MKSGNFHPVFKQRFCGSCRSTLSNAWVVPKRSGNFRVLAATNRDLEASVREKVFREDLYYRLNVVRIPVPPLRERRSDIVPLAEHFLRLYSDKNGLPAIGFSDEAILCCKTISIQEM